MTLIENRLTRPASSADVERQNEIAGSAVDPSGNRVVLLERIWLGKIISTHPEISVFKDEVLETVAAPDWIEPDRCADRLRFFSKEKGPAPWMMVVVSYEQQPARVITAYGHRKGPPAWKTSS